MQVVRLIENREFLLLGMSISFLAYQEWMPLDYQEIDSGGWDQLPLGFTSYNQVQRALLQEGPYIIKERIDQSLKSEWLRGWAL